MDTARSGHPTQQMLSSFGLGKLNESLVRAVSIHLERCPECRKQVGELPPDSFLGRLRDAKPTDKSDSGKSQFTWSRSVEGMVDPARAHADTLPPELVDHPDYEIKRELGRGGMGVVYLAHNKLMGRDEVLKVMGRHIMERPGVLDRFLREIRAVAKLRHPNIVTAYHATRLGESIVFAMEYVAGLDLSRMVKAKGPLPVTHACYFAYQAALGLQHAHEEGLVHRDIKPGNLMLSNRKDKATIKILDFGLAKATREEKIDLKLTSEGQALGTPDYIAPEQIMDATSADIRADIYSLGGTLYHLLTGCPPFHADSLYDMYQAHISRDADPLNLVRPEVPAELAALVAKMMAKDPTRRFQTPGEVAAALTPFVKKGNVAFKGPKLDVSRASRSIAGQPVGEAVSMPAQPVTEPPGSAVRAKTVVEPTVPAARWESLVGLRETASSTETPPVVAPVRRAPRPFWPVVIAASLFGLFALGVVIITIRGKNGETKITARDDKAFKVETPDVVVEHNPTGDSTPAKARSNTPKAPRPDIPGASRTVKPLTAITNSIGMNLVPIPAGEFIMGSPLGQGSEDEHPQHHVRITRPFYMGVTEVTQAQYQGVVGSNPSWFSPRGGGKDRVAGESTDDHPVENVSWLDAVAYCNTLSENEKREPFYDIEAGTARVRDWNGPGYRLPTEAEWEYACRSNSRTRYSFGNDEANFGEHGWYKDNSGGRTHPVGQKRSNDFGLFDMHGNVWEWCWDGFDANYYKASPVDDPRGPSGAWFRVNRNGGWIGPPSWSRSAACAIGRPPDHRDNGIGFRVARNVADEIRDLSAHPKANSSSRSPGPASAVAASPTASFQPSTAKT